MKTLVVGGGSIGKRHALNILNEFDHAEVTLVTNFSSREDDLFKDKRVVVNNSIDSSQAYDLVYIASPASRHLKDLNSINENCRKVLVEKPLFNGFEERNFPIKKNNWEKIYVGYILRFDPIIYKTKELIKSGKLGDLYFGRIWAGQFLPEWRPNTDYRKTVSAQRKLGGGPLHELSHEIDYITYLLDSTPSKVLCDLQKLTNLEIDTEDFCSLKFKFNRVNINLDLDFIANPAKLGFCLFFKNGTIEADFVSRKLEVLFRNNLEKIDVEISSFNSLYIEQLHHLNSQKKNKKINLVEPALIQDSNRTMSIIKACIKSYECSRFVEVN